MAVVVSNATGGSSTKCTVTFNSNGGSTVAKKTVTYGSRVVRPTNPSKSGYTFVGWFLNGVTYNFNNSVTKDITLIAKWQKNDSSSSSDEEKKKQEEELKRQQAAELEAKKSSERSSINSTLDFVDDSFSDISSLLSMVYNILAEDIIIDGATFLGAEIENIKNKLG